MKALLFLIMALLPLAQQVQAQTIKPLSRGWHRLPYIDGTALQGPGGSLFEGHNGHDIIGTPLKAWDDPSPHKIVATAHGVVIEVEDSYDECGLFTDSTGEAALCNNFIWVDHLNGDFTVYLHIAFQSARVDSGDAVVEGQWIADEGDVGSTFSSDTEYNRPKIGCAGDQNWADSTFPSCGMHLHISFTDEFLASSAVLVHPRICGTTSHVFIQTSDTNTCVPCDAGACVSDTVISESYGAALRVIVTDNSVTTRGEVIIGNSVVGFQAGTYITLYPGFSARAGSYFRAEIGTCEGQ